MQSCWTCFYFTLKQCVQEFSFTFAYFQSSDWFFALYLPSNPNHEIKSMKFLGRRIFSLWSGFLLVFFNKLVQLISLHHSLVPLLVLSCIDMRLPSFVKSKMHFFIVYRSNNNQPKLVVFKTKQINCGNRFRQYLV
jgi:hypothetical protein